MPKQPHSSVAAFVCPNCEETTFPDEAGTVVCPECGANIETTPERPAASALARLDAVVGELANRLPADEDLASWAERYGDALEVVMAQEKALREIAEHDLLVDYADCELRNIARRALRAGS